MQREKVIENTFKLSDSIKNSSEYKELKKKEKWLEEDKKTSKWLLQYKEAYDLLEQIRKNKEHKKFEGNLLNNLSKIKEKLDMDPLVVAYKKAYRQYEKMIKEVDEHVFKDIKKTKKRPDFKL